MTPGVSGPTYPGDANTQKVERTMLALSKAMRAQRAQADALVALIEQATASDGDGKGRLIDVRA